MEDKRKSVRLRILFRADGQYLKVMPLRNKGEKNIKSSSVASLSIRADTGLE